MQSKILIASFAFVLIALLAVSAVVTAFGFGNKANLTDEQKTEMQAQQKAMQTAIESGDYAAWKSLMEDRVAEMQAQITEENFKAMQTQHEQMQQIREAMQSGDYETAQALREQYGIEDKGFGKGMGDGRGMGGPRMHEGIPFTEAD